MFFKNLKYFWRGIKRDKTFALINLFGMTAGILVALLAGFYAFYQLSYDKFIKDHDRIYRLEYINHYTGNTKNLSWCSYSFAKVMRSEIPGIKDVMCLQQLRLTIQLVCDEKKVDLVEWMNVSKNFLEYQDVEFIYGTRESCFDTTRKMVITESLAKKYFPNQNPIGKELKLEVNNAVFFYNFRRHKRSSAKFSYQSKCLHAGGIGFT